MASVSLPFSSASNGTGSTTAWTISGTLGSGGNASNGPYPYSGIYSDVLQIFFNPPSTPIPTGSVITGWSCSITRNGSSGGTVADETVTTSIGDASGSCNNYATGGNWSSSSSTPGYGTGTTDTWGLTAPDVASVNSTGAGIYLTVGGYPSGGSATVTGASFTGLSVSDRIVWVDENDVTHKLVVVLTRNLAGRSNAWEIRAQERVRPKRWRFPIFPYA